MINILAVGKIKKKFILDSINYYLKQTPINIIEIKQTNIDNESNNILSKLDTKDYVIACDIKASLISTIDLYNIIENLELNSKKIYFIIGGSNGFNDSVRKRADLLISFSKMTFPHEIFRLMLVEQLYRTKTIKANKPYHK